MTAVLSLAGLGQVLEFMYTAKLSLSPENVDDVLAVASFLQMQDIITACHTLKSLAEPTSTPGESADTSAVEGELIGWLLLKSSFLDGAPACLWVSSLGLTFLIYLTFIEGVLVRRGEHFWKGSPCPHACPFYLWAAEDRSHTPGPLGAQSCYLSLLELPFRKFSSCPRGRPQKPVDSYHGSGQGSCLPC